MARLVQGDGIHTRSVNDNILFIKCNQVPVGRKITYANPVCDYRPQKGDPYRVRLTVGGDLLPYPFDVGSPEASLLEAEILFKWCNLYPRFLLYLCRYQGLFLCSPMDQNEYIKISFQWKKHTSSTTYMISWTWMVMFTVMFAKTCKV